MILSKIGTRFNIKIGNLEASWDVDLDQARPLDSARGRGWFWAFGWSGGVVLGGFGVGRDLGGMGRVNRTQCSWWWKRGGGMVAVAAVAAVML